VLQVRNQTPLHLAVENEHAEVIRLILEKSSKLHHAAEGGNMDKIRQLLEDLEGTDILSLVNSKDQVRGAQGVIEVGGNMDGHMSEWG
jgi:ankyrin repeat protein